LAQYLKEDGGEFETSGGRDQMKAINITKTFATVLLGILLLAGTTAAQYGNPDVRDLVRSIQTRTDTLSRTLQSASERGNVSSYNINELNRLLNDFRSATDQIDQRLNTRRTTSADIRTVMDRARLIDNFLVNNRLGSGVRRDWFALRGDLDQLASAYNLNWQWSDTASTGTGNDSYNLSEVQVRQLVERINTRTSAFSRSLRMDLNRRIQNGRYSTTQVQQQLSSFESAVMDLRNSYGGRQFSSTALRNLLQPAAYLNTFVSDQRLSYETQNNWTPLKQDLDRLASAYNIAWDWSNVPGGGYGTNADLTGTYQLNTSQGDDARNAVDAATRNLSQVERQRVYDSLLRRLDPPQMLAIDRRGNAVTIASSRAPQINFTADGREQVETNPNGRTVRVRAQLSGDELSITRTGDRAQDFTVTFQTLDGGRRLLVTRSLYSDRITQPVIVRTYYDKVSDVAQLNLYDTNRENGNVDTSTNANFVIPNGTELVAVLNNQLSTENVHQNDRFTMTVRSPSQYDGATIEGYVASLNRSGRITGRSDMTLDFDTIRLRDGRTYRFAGILESVRTRNGDVIRVDNEGAVKDNDQTNTTITRTAIGTAVGAIIGAIAGGGKGAAIGAVVGAGAGAGSVYIQGRNDLVLDSGTEISIRATGPRNN
jgi:hypothetical protein